MSAVDVGWLVAWVRVLEPTVAPTALATVVVALGPAVVHVLEWAWVSVPPVPSFTEVTATSLGSNPRGALS